MWSRWGQRGGVALAAAIVDGVQAAVSRKADWIGRLGPDVATSLICFVVLVWGWRLWCYVRSALP